MPSIVLACVLLIVGVDGRCGRFANRIYLITLDLPGKVPFNSFLTLLPGGIFNNIPSSAQHLTRNTYSNIVGYYRCANSTALELRGVAFFYPNPDSTTLGTTGAIGLFEYELKFTEGLGRCSGRSLLTYFEAGTDPYNPSNMPIRNGTYAGNTGILQWTPMRNWKATLAFNAEHHKLRKQSIFIPTNMISASFFFFVHATNTF